MLGSTLTAPKVLHILCRWQVFGDDATLDELSRVTILSHKVTCIASKHDVIYLALSTFPCNYHLIDVNKMVNYILANILTCIFSLSNYLGKVLPKAIAKQLLQVSCTPTFYLVYFASSLLVF